MLELARELDYAPSAAARTLVTKRSQVVGVLLETGAGHPDLQHPFFQEVLVGLKRGVGAGRVRPAALRHRTSRKRFRDGVGACAAPATIASTAWSSWASTLTTPRCSEARAVAHRVHRRRSRPRRAADRLRDVGQRRGRATRRLATCTSSATGGSRPSPARPGHGRASTACSASGRSSSVWALESRGLRAGRRLLPGDRFCSYAGTSRARRAADGGLRASDLMAVGAIRAAHERGVRVPDDMSVVGFDDAQLAGADAAAADHDPAGQDRSRSSGRRGARAYGRPPRYEPAGAGAAGRARRPRHRLLRRPAPTAGGELPELRQSERRGLRFRKRFQKVRRS